MHTNAYIWKMPLWAYLVFPLLCGCATKPVKAPEPAPVPIAAFAVACETTRGLVPQSIYIVFTKRLAIHWTREGVTVMELGPDGEEHDTEIGTLPLESILKLARAANITDELRLGYGCDVMEAANPL
jgi:hypothetical protein